MSQLQINADIITRRYNIDFEKNDNIGHNNWIIPGLVMTGVYPGLDGINFTTHEKAKDNINTILSHGIDTFICLQNEITSDHKLKEEFNILFPNFYHYINYFPNNNNKLIYYHWPTSSFNDIKSMAGPFTMKIMHILELLLRGRKIFIHCTGGHGRSGVYAAVLIYLLEKVTVVEALRRTLERHDSRKKRDKRNLPSVLSPCSIKQRKFVYTWVDIYKYP